MEENMEQVQRLELQLQSAQAADLDILNKYAGERVVMEALGSTYGGTLERVGSEFVYLTSAVKYTANLYSLEKFPEQLERFDLIADRTISKSGIEEIVLLKDIGEER
jgi:hypothetical protein